MKYDKNQIMFSILLYIIVFGVIYIINQMNNIITEQAYISKQIESIQRGNQEIIERLNQPLIIDN